MNRVLAGSRSEIEAAGRKLVQVDGRPDLEIGVYCLDGEFYAYRSACPHQGASVCKGRVSGTRLPSAVYEYKYGRDREILRCPWHGWEFDLRTGEQLYNATGTPVKLRRYQVEVEGENVYIILGKS